MQCIVSYSYINVFITLAWIIILFFIDGKIQCVTMILHTTLLRWNYSDIGGNNAVEPLTNFLHFSGFLSLMLIDPLLYFRKLWLNWETAIVRRCGCINYLLVTQIWVKNLLKWLIFKDLLNFSIIYWKIPSKWNRLL